MDINQLIDLHLFDPVMEVIEFIGQMFLDFYDGFMGIINIFASFIKLLNTVIGILPNPLYDCFLFFLTIFSLLFMYKLIRQG